MNYYDVSRANVTAIYDTPTSNDSSYDISRANVTATSIAAYLARLPFCSPTPVLVPRIEQARCRLRE